MLQLNPSFNDISPSKKKHMFLVRISIKKRAGGRCFLLIIIFYSMLSLHIITFPRGYVGALRSNINKTKHQIVIKHKFVSFWNTQRVNSENLHILVCTQQQWALQVTPVDFCL